MSGDVQALLVQTSSQLGVDQMQVLKLALSVLLR